MADKHGAEPASVCAVQPSEQKSTCMCGERDDNRGPLRQISRLQNGLCWKNAKSRH
jgi:hypothetical protein